MVIYSGEVVHGRAPCSVVAIPAGCRRSQVENLTPSRIFCKSGGAIRAGSPRALLASAVGGPPPAPQWSVAEREVCCNKLGKVSSHIACVRFTLGIRFQAAKDSGKSRKSSPGLKPLADPRNLLESGVNGQGFRMAGKNRAAAERVPRT